MLQKDHLSHCNETPSSIAADMQSDKFSLSSHNIISRLGVKRGAEVVTIYHGH